MSDELQWETQDGIATVTLNRPRQRNALNAALLGQLATCFARLEDSRETRVVIVRGEGPAFCSGMDLRELGRRQDENADPEVDVTGILQQIERSRHPTIAVVHGDAFAGGCELALHCDLRVAADVARFAMPLARLGLIVPFPLGCKLVEIVGPAFTREMLLTGTPVPAVRAYEIGMVHRVVPLADLEATALEIARSIATNAPLSLAGMKATIRRAAPLRTLDHADLDDLARRARKSADAREGVRAMLEKRAPVFRGE
jgi:enoyl-CoA hydratase/carnithine racemase